MRGREHNKEVTTRVHKWPHLLLQIDIPVADSAGQEELVVILQLKWYTVCQ